MLSLLRVLVCVASLVTLSACNPAERTYLREGIGSDLFAEDVVQQTRLQDLYVQHICEQAGLGGGRACDPEALGPRAWTVFVQAGLNDIDQRCDAYLVWLDSRRRAREPVLQEISDIRTATTAILAATGAGVEPIAIAAAAFGLTSSSFTNVNSSLVFALDQSTIQAVVLSRQQQFRQDLPQAIDNRAAAIYALRSYMRLCMPMTIDTQVNTTVRLFEQGGRFGTAALAAAQAHPLIDARTVRFSLLQSARSPVPIFKPAPVVVVADDVRVGPYEQSLVKSDVADFEAVVCLPKDGRLTGKVRTAVLTYLTTNQLKDNSFPDRITAKDGTRLRDALDAGPRC